MNLRWIELPLRTDVPTPFNDTTRLFRARTKNGKLTVIVEDHDHFGLHLSISHDVRNPTWEEQVAAVRRFLPDDRPYHQIIPPESEYVNAHEFCFHWWEMPRPDGEA